MIESDCLSFGAWVMTTTTWTSADTMKARQIWAEYQQSHDVSDKRGQAAGIDPINGRIWFGESASDIKRQKEGAGIDSLLFVIRVGSDCYLRKGRSRGWMVV